ncbi:hypothetical protein BG844_37425 [Couchioplanes caeruleus subsp. caeruleus]|uniref:Uncharacterized protein n=1 Tax=Couchioplanes caeruleus subsp. caeruleus TaxID=56427 RepID=A0A1K0GJX4_9ACTN|nr:hypothetical protein BG844_37425 [Couchioplanes caeruleus subsp. caeruleus]
MYGFGFWRAACPLITVLLRSYMMARAWVFSCSCWAADTGGNEIFGGSAGSAASACCLACQERFALSFASYCSNRGCSLWRARLRVSVTVEKVV